MLESDVMLQGHDTCKYVFTDITFGVPGEDSSFVGQTILFNLNMLSDRKRLVAVREQEGSLRSATWEERDRVLHTYFPKPGRYEIFSQTWQV